MKCAEHAGAVLSGRRTPTAAGRGPVAVSRRVYPPPRCQSVQPYVGVSKRLSREINHNLEAIRKPIPRCASFQTGSLGVNHWCCWFEGGSDFRSGIKLFT
ncbi:hypothetical protein GUJ93_ZPchr0013g35270 [Zizania palustris]|uniref:Uncharacterized protein n=1 Tax=Zizania palustris TaxID=103762 RepID=A0A8J5X393_ZIZPA|nr:hypothetical protein GUJ93_ZPchr0013g35270 [Zizania palustris]